MKTHRLAIALLASAAMIGIPTAARASDGAALYKSKCQSCHAADGSGSSPAGKAMHVRDLRSDEVQKLTDIELTKVISGGKGRMPAYGKQLSVDDIKALIAFIRTLKP